MEAVCGAVYYSNKLSSRLIPSSPSFPVSLIGWGQIRRGVTITPTVDDD